MIQFADHEYIDDRYVPPNVLLDLLDRFPGQIIPSIVFFFIESCDEFISIVYFFWIPLIPFIHIITPFRIAPEDDPGLFVYSYISSIFSWTNAQMFFVSSSDSFAYTTL